MAIRLREKTRLDYKQMNDGEEIVVERKTKTTRVVLPELYEAEEIIATKECPKEGTLYLVKWKNYGLHECTWEPKRHLTESLLDHFNRPTLSDDFIACFSKSFENNIQKRLKSRMETFSIDFPNRLFKFAFDKTATVLACREDFKKLTLSEYWDCSYRSNGYGIGLEFPLSITPVLYFKDVFVPVDGQIEKRRVPIEKIRVTSSVRAINV